LHHEPVPDREHHEEALTHAEPFHKLVIALLKVVASCQYSLNSIGVPAAVEFVEFNE
jgi:hypothetical protein